MNLKRINELADKETIVIKVGTDLIADKQGLPHTEVMESIINQIEQLQEQYHVVLVSSGAVAFGRSLDGVEKSDDETVDDKQHFFSIGQPKLIAAYDKIAEAKGIIVAQELLAKKNFLRGSDLRNLRRNLVRNLTSHNKTLPIVNENDTIATQELMFTDNDQLAGCLARSLGATRLVIASTVNGLLENIHDATSTVERLTQEDREAAYNLLSEEGSQNGKGGMRSKLDIGFDASKRGIQTHIINGTEDNSIVNAVKGQSDTSTVFQAVCTE